MKKDTVSRLIDLTDKIVNVLEQLHKTDVLLDYQIRRIRRENRK